jgi:hypothetical protein
MFFFIYIKKMSNISKPWAWDQLESKTTIDKIVRINLKDDNIIF